MKRFLKKALTGTLAALMLASSVFAANGEMDNMVFVGYDVAMYDAVAIDGNDTTIAPDWDAPNKVYTEVIDGKYTGKTVLVPVAADWQFEGYEAVYPYAGYYRLYLEGNKQEITDYKGNAGENEGYVFPQWQTKRVDYMWQMSYPYTVWERQQTLVNNTTWTWDFGNDAWGILDSAVLVPTNKTATVVNVEWDKYGFGKYDNEGNLLNILEVAMYDYFEADAALVNLESLLNPEVLSARDAKGAYVLSDAEIAEMIPVVYSKNLTAKFNKVGDEGLTTKDIAVEWLANPARYEWTWDNAVAEFKCVSAACKCHNSPVYTAKINSTCDLALTNATTVDACSFYVDYTTAKVEWSPVYYELAAPYKQYQYLIVDGVALDGSIVEGGRRERVYRYTGGVATPKLEWRFAFYQAADGRYVEQRYVDGVPEVDFYGNPVYRVSEVVHEESYQTPEGFNATYYRPSTYYNFSITGKYVG